MFSTNLDDPKFQIWHTPNFKANNSFQNNFEMPIKKHTGDKHKVKRSQCGL